MLADSGEERKKLESELLAALKNQTDVLKTSEQITPDNIEGILINTHKILGLSWIENVPGMKEKAREILKYQPLIV